MHALRVAYRNLPNAVSVLGVLPLVALFTPTGPRYLAELIFFTNFMDDVDGALARELNLRSSFGGALDNVCDAAGHLLLVLAVGGFAGGYVLVFAMLTAAAILVRITRRVHAPDSNGSPTNELLRHLFLVLLAARATGLALHPLLAATLFVHAVTMVCPFPMPYILRTRATKTVPIFALNVLLTVAYAVPWSIPLVASPFVVTYFASIYAGLRRPRA